MAIGSTTNGGSLDLVCSIRVFDVEHSSHLMHGRDGVSFLFEGLLSDEFHSFTILGGVLKQQFPIPVIVSTRDTVIMGHRRPTWDSLLSTVDLCAGFGGLAQGAAAAGFSVQVAVDQNQKMLDFYSKVNDAHLICGDIGDRKVLHEIWRHSAGALTVTSGFSCQPFSRLGDCKSHEDDRASCLTKTLRTAYYLQAHLIVLECVAPAAQDGFVRQELSHFMKCTGYHCTQTELKLDQVWPCRRHRSWWVLSSPEIGPVEIQPWHVLPSIHEVQQVIPEIRLWALNDEQQLALDEVELQAFGVNDEKHGKHILNGKGKAPCALHAWGSQTRACPCGCRKFGFSSERLATKGLHGCIVRSAVFPDGSTIIRHVHPNEVMGLNTYDPVIDFGTDVRLTLSAVGQLACPAQALWVLGAIVERIDTMRNSPTFDPVSQLQAYRSWLIMRCRMVWPSEAALIQDPKFLELMTFWKDFQNLSLQELVYPLKWEGKIEGTVSIAAILDHLIRSKPDIRPTIPDPESKTEEEDIPVFDFPCVVDDPTTVGCMCADSCTVVFSGINDPPIRFQPKCGTTIDHFLHAQAQLNGPFGVAGISINGVNVQRDHVLEVGQVIQVSLEEVANPISAVGHPGVSPTAQWTQPVTEKPVQATSRKVSKFDVGECLTPTMVLPDDHTWLDSSALQGLAGEQFLKLQMPCVQTAQHLWSLRHQYLRTSDRLAIFERQLQFWADDEIRFHLHAVTQAYQETRIRAGAAVHEICTIDPLIFTAWAQNKGFDIALWATDHPEILEKSVPIVTVALLDCHWVPIFMSPVKGVLQIHTWDGMGASHPGLDEVVNTLAKALGFQSAMICREHRLFFTSELCGSLAIAFIRYILLGTQLPNDCTEATVIHARLKGLYSAELQKCQIARRPWIWGAGDRPPTGTSVASSDLQLAVNVTRDQRIDLINAKGFAMADDEIRFHILSLVENQQRSHLPFLERRFITLEPLVFNCWDSIGQIIASQWCAKNPQIYAQGQNVVTAVALEDHWIPLWMVPDGHMLQVHTFQADVDFTPIDNIINTLATNLGFRGHVVHKIPHGLPEHVMCGAHAMTFIAHVVVRMPLPRTLQELRTAHTNMRASFVAHLYSIGYTPKPVVWGNGSTGESGQLPIMPEDDIPAQSDPLGQRRQERSQMLITHNYAMGNDEIEFHLQHLLDCHAQGPRAIGPVRKFVAIPPKTLDSWMQGDSTLMLEWYSVHWNHVPKDTQVVAVILIDQHWVPFWISPNQSSAHCHTLGDFARDDQVVTQVLGDLSQFLGFDDVMIHRVPHGIDVTRLCGAMSISFLAHIMLNTRLPQDDHQLRARCWNMKEVFAAALNSAEVEMPTMWGWGVRESRPLPIMPGAADLPAEGASHALPDCQATKRGAHQALVGMHHHEMKFHLSHLITFAPLLCAIGMVLDCIHQMILTILAFSISVRQWGGFAFLSQMHWMPIVCQKVGNQVWVWVEQGPVAEILRDKLPFCKVFSIEGAKDACCGAHTWSVLAGLSGFQIRACEDIRSFLHHMFQLYGQPVEDASPARWGFGPQGQLIQKLVKELQKHGIPDEVVEDRATSAIKTLGSEQVIAALNHRNPWKQLKLLGTNSKFQFVMPSELADAVETNKGKAIKAKGKGKGKNFPQPIELDPAKLQVIEGTFHSAGHALTQLTMKQIGPVSSGFILISLHDAEPYLRAGTAVSREPLALLVLQKPGVEIKTALPHTSVTVPCRCNVNNEPVLADVVAVQLGAGIVEKTCGNAVVSVDTPEVATLKIMVYKDELRGDWDDFCSAPIRCLVSLLPKLKRCFSDNCTCPAWHNSEGLPLRDPILDVWRRQFLRMGFKPCPAGKAEIFSVCIRIPMCILEPLLAASGTSGAYCEPRTADGKEILAEYTVVWTQKHTPQEMQHLLQTNPAVTGLARLGERRGLRVHVNHAKAIHQLIRPDTVFLPNGPKNQYTVGPFPYGVDRQAVAKIMQQSGWECRPLQPTAPCPGRGAMWSVQATDDPEQPIVSTTCGEIVVTRQKPEQQTPTKSPATVGSAATLALCGTNLPKPDTDPWTHTDPWRMYHPPATGSVATGPTEGMQQIEERIQTAVLAKMQPPMEDDIPDRVHALEGQLHQLIAKQQGLESQFNVFSDQNSQQINALQNQVAAQSQQLHGYLENQNQTMQSLFEQQMHQIRGLLSKRPREESLE